MPTLSVTVDGTGYEISVGRDSRIVVDGREHECEVRQIDRHRYLLLLDGRLFRIATRRDGDRYEVLVGAAQHSVTLSRGSSASRGDGAARGALSGEVRAPMPALVARLLVSPGDTVRSGQGLLVLEAMKMENEIRSARAGVVQQILVAPGTPVEKGQLLMVFG